MHSELIIFRQCKPTTVHICGRSGHHSLTVHHKPNTQQFRYMYALHRASSRPSKIDTSVV